MPDRPAAVVSSIGLIPQELTKSEEEKTRKPKKGGITSQEQIDFKVTPGKERQQVLSASYPHLVDGHRATNLISWG